MTLYNFPLGNITIPLDLIASVRIFDGFSGRPREDSNYSYKELKIAVSFFFSEKVEYIVIGYIRGRGEGEGSTDYYNRERKETEEKLAPFLAAWQQVNPPAFIKG